jgi:H+-transporting ATPase
MILEADGFAHVYPEHKFLIVECLRQQGFKCGMTGDGVNDAPALKRADVGIAVSGATDAARAASDIVLTSPGLSVVVEAIIIARCIFQRVQNFINYRIAATLQLLCFFFISVFAFPPNQYDPSFPEFFQLPVLLLMLITLLNDGTLITIGYDTVRPSQHPEKWNLPLLFLVSIVLAAVACGSSLLLLWCALDSNNPHGVFQAGFGLPRMAYSEIVMMIYMKVSISDFLTLFSARTRSFFFTAKPGPLLLAGGLVALSISTILACTWPAQDLDSVPISGLAVTGNYHLWPLWIWIYCIIWWLIQDTLKVLTYTLVYKFHIFGASAAQHMVHSDDPEAEATKAGKATAKGDNQV